MPITGLRRGGHNEADYAEQARAVKAAGFTGLKFDPFAHTNYSVSYTHLTLPTTPYV